MRLLSLGVALTCGVALGGVATAAPAVTTSADPGGCGKGVAGDVNGDGRADAVVGEPGARKGAGAVRVLYGTAAGLIADGTPDDQVLAQDTPGVPGEPTAGGRFGAALVTADFDGDGCGDVAVGSPGENRNHGAVTLLFGSPAGLSGARALRFAPGQGGVPRVVRAALFGSALAAGDFDGDGETDLAIGAPDDGLAGTGRERGSVTVLRGPAHPAPTAVKISAAPAPADGECFGQALAAGDFDGDGVDDLAVGVPGRAADAGALVVLPGKKGMPLGSAPAPVFDQSVRRVPGTSEPGDMFGVVLAAGDVTGDGRDDLAVGVPGEDGGKGAVTLLPGGPGGLRGPGGDAWRQGFRGVQGTSARTHFGLALAIGRLDGDPYADLIVGSEDADGKVALAGALTMLRGSATGLTTAGRGGVRMTQHGISHQPVQDARFGRTVAIIAVAGQDRETVLVGAPRWTTSARAPVAGAFFELRPAAEGPSGRDARMWTASTAGVRGDPVAYGWLASSLG